MWFTIAATVEVFPLPVTPATSTSPCSAWQSLDRRR